MCLNLTKLEARRSSFYGMGRTCGRLKLIAGLMAMSIFSATGAMGMIIMTGLKIQLIGRQCLTLPLDRERELG